MPLFRGVTHVALTSRINSHFVDSCQCNVTSDVCLVGVIFFFPVLPHDIEANQLLIQSAAFLTDCFFYSTFRSCQVKNWPDLSCWKTRDLQERGQSQWVADTEWWSDIFVWSFNFSSVLLQIAAEEIKDNRVVNFEVQARKLDNKVWIILYYCSVT